MYRVDILSAVAFGYCNINSSSSGGFEFFLVMFGEFCDSTWFVDFLGGCFDGRDFFFLF